MSDTEQSVITVSSDIMSDTVRRPIMVSFRNLNGDVILGPVAQDPGNLILALKYAVAIPLNTVSQYVDLCYQNRMLDSSTTLGDVQSNEAVELVAIRKCPMLMAGSNDEEVVLEAVPNDEESAEDYLLFASCEFFQDGKWVYSEVDEIVFDTRTGDRFYRVAFDDGEIDYCTRAELIEFLSEGDSFSLTDSLLDDANDSGCGPGSASS